MNTIRQMLKRILLFFMRPILVRYVPVEEFETREAVLKSEIDQLSGRFLQENDSLKNMMRQEIDSAINMMRQEDHNLRFDVYTTLLQETGNRNELLGSNIINSAMQSRLLLAEKNFVTSENMSASKNHKWIEPAPFEEYLNQFKQLYPHLYDVWASINLGVNIDVYRNSPSISCGVDTRENARLFRGFVAPYLQGRVLDVGCGPYAVPNYLKGYPIELISGIDPLKPFEPHPFEFVQGFAEFLPWPDSTFEVLIAATSLDHVISLDQAISEIYRVLKPDGIFLTWDWFGENTKPYDPSRQPAELIDNYHLFNFSEGWFEEIMLKKFSIEEKVKLYGDWTHDRFYALRRKKEN